MPENSIVDTPRNTSYFTKFTHGGKGFKIIRSNVSLQDLSSIDFSSFEDEVVDPNFGADSSYFFESQQFKLNPCKTVLTKESLTKVSAKSATTRTEKALKVNFYREKSSYNNTNVPSFSRFYNELKNLKKVDPNLRSKLSFTYFC